MFNINSLNRQTGCEPKIKCLHHKIEINAFLCHRETLAVLSQSVKSQCNFLKHKTAAESSMLSYQIHAKAAGIVSATLIPRELCVIHIAITTFTDNRVHTLLSGYLPKEH